jgi:hypothetical protein
MRKSFTSQMYRVARDSANVRAAKGGSASLGKRVVRRSVIRTANRPVGRALRRFGLW